MAGIFLAIPRLALTRPALHGCSTHRKLWLPPHPPQSSPFPPRSTFPLTFLQLASMHTMFSGTPLAFGEEGIPPIPQNTTDTVSQTVQSGAISFLLLGSFVGLSLLTLGVIYLAVSDFFEKREREKELKLMTSEEKNKKSKKVVRSRTGPRGFGQKLEDDF